MTTFHANCVSIGRRGVLLLGPSGAGKSDLALRLIDGGARLVADDRCELFVRAGRLCASAPASIAGLLELRGIGIVKLPHAASVSIRLAVELTDRKRADHKMADRLPGPRFHAPAGLAGFAAVPLIGLDGAEASAPARFGPLWRLFRKGGSATLLTVFDPIATTPMSLFSPPLLERS